MAIGDIEVSGDVSEGRDLVEFEILGNVSEGRNLFDVEI